jgi:poly(3-hydroxybutyrate) depolymerase
MMRTRRVSAAELIVLASLILGLTSCSGPTATPVTTSSSGSVRHDKLTSHGLLRSNRLFIPGSLTKGSTVPLVVMLHACRPDANGDGQLRHAFRFGGGPRALRRRLS